MLTAGEVAKALGAKLEGDASLPLAGVAPIDSAGRSDLTFLSNPRYLEAARATHAGAVIVSEEVCGISAPALIRADNPYAAFARALALVCPPEQGDGEISPHACIGRDVHLGEGVTVEPKSVIGDRCRIGARTWVMAGAVVQRETVIGPGCVIHPNVTICERVSIGARVIIHAGAVIGADGFGFARDGQRYIKIPQVGTVVIEDDVEIGASSTIDRATLGETRIGAGTKIDNLVQVAHNVTIGKDSAIAALSGISGSSSLGKGATLAGQSGVAGHLTIGANVTIGGKSAVFKDLPDGAFVRGIPARPHRQWMRREASLARVGKLRDRLLSLLQKLEKESV